MSQENVEIVRRAYDAFNRGAWDAAFENVASHAEWETDARLPNAGTYRGRIEIQRLFEDQATAFDESVTELERLLLKGDQIVALVKLRRRPTGSTAAIEAEIAHLWTFEGGQVVRIQAFARREEALEAAGLSE